MSKVEIPDELYEWLIRKSRQRGVPIDCRTSYVEKNVEFIIRREMLRQIDRSEELEALGEVIAKAIEKARCRTPL